MYHYNGRNIGGGQEEKIGEAAAVAGPTF